jgi:hypothetical protein
MKARTRIAVEAERHEAPKQRTERPARYPLARRLPRFARRLNPLGEVGRTLTAGLVAMASVFMLPAGTGIEIYWALPWNVWALTYLTLTWFVILRSSPRHTRQWAGVQREAKGGWLPSIAMALFQVGRTGGLHFIVIVSQVGLGAAVVLVLPQVRDGSLASASLIALSALGGPEHRLHALLHLPILRGRGDLRRSGVPRRQGTGYARLRLLRLRYRHELRHLRRAGD